MHTCKACAAGLLASAHPARRLCSHLRQHWQVLWRRLLLLLLCGRVLVAILRRCRRRCCSRLGGAICVLTWRHLLPWTLLRGQQVFLRAVVGVQQLQSFQPQASHDCANLCAMLPGAHTAAATACRQAAGQDKSSSSRVAAAPGLINSAMGAT